MPKEVVRSVMDAPVVLPEGVAIEDQPANEPFRVEVGWSRERGDVSIATIDPSKSRTKASTSGSIARGSTI